MTIARITVNSIAYYSISSQRAEDALLFLSPSTLTEVDVKRYHSVNMGRINEYLTSKLGLLSLVFHTL